MELGKTWYMVDLYMVDVSFLMSRPNLTLTVVGEADAEEINGEEARVGAERAEG
jgi:hypothetical protein